MRLIKRHGGQPPTSTGGGGWMAPYQQGQPLQQMPMQGLQQQPMQLPGTNLGNWGGKGITNQGPNQSFSPSGKGVNQQPTQQPGTLFNPQSFTTAATQNQQAAAAASAAAARQATQNQQNPGMFQEMERQRLGLPMPNDSSA